MKLLDFTPVLTGLIQMEGNFIAFNQIIKRDGKFTFVFPQVIILN